jgi:hypothetical protein
MMGVAIAAQGQQKQSLTPWSDSLLPILETLDSARVSGSLEFSGRCEPGYKPDLPKFSAPPKSSPNFLQTLRQILANDPSIAVTLGSDGNVRMIEKDVQTDLLNVKISHISFETDGVPLQYGAYNPNEALHYVILKTPEVAAFMKAHNIRWPSGGGVRGNLFDQWTPDKPHISGSMDNVTVYEILDRVLKTFPGMWIYENCPRNGNRDRDVYFDFLSIGKTAGRVFVVGG